MKKALIMLLLVMAIVGSFGLSQAAPPDGGECSGVVDLDCNITNPDGSKTHCLVYVNLAENDPGVGIICQDAPPPPAV